MRTPHRRIQHVSLATLLSLGLLFVMAASASAHSVLATYTTVPAHAKVYKAIPAIGSTIAQAPTAVTVFTLENINPDPKKCSGCAQQPTGNVHFDQTERERCLHRALDHRFG